MKEKQSLLKTIFTVDVLFKVLKSKWFYIILFVFIVGTYGNNKYKKLIVLPDDAKDLTSSSFSLGSPGGTPGYQTKKAQELAIELKSLEESRTIKILTGLYYKLYKQKFSAGRLATQKIKVTEDQFDQIYYMVANACEVLGIPKDKFPKIWLSRDDANILTVTNFNNPSIIIGADYLWAFKPAELEFLLARQVANIRLNNIFYLDLIKGVKSIADAALPDFISKFVIGGMGIKLMDWYKEASISADRGGLLVTGDPQQAISALIKLNLGVNIEDIYGDPNPLAYIKQIKDLPNDDVTTAAAAMAEMANDNPFVTVRVRHLLNWIKTPMGQKSLKYRWSPTKPKPKSGRPTQILEYEEQ